MKSLLVTGKREARIDNIEIPKIKENELLIKVEAAGLCGTDCHIYLGEYFSDYPIVPGHEFSGVVEKAGKDVTQFKVGDRVSADPNIFCEKCYFCKQNLQNHCENFQAVGVTRNGAFAEYVAVPEANVFPIGDIDFVHAAMIEPLSCVVYGQERARISTGQQVLIFGAGAIGLLHLQLSKHNGAASVTVVDLNPDRLKKAEKLGANHTVLAGQDMERNLRDISARGFQTVIDATGVPSVVENALKYVRNDGTLLVFGVCPNNSKITISPYEIFHRDIKIIGSFALRKTFTQSIALIEGGVVDVSPLIGEVVSLSNLPDAIERMISGQTPMKVIAKPEI